MTDGPLRRDGPLGRDVPEGLPALLRARERGGGTPWPEGTPRVEVRTASIRLPGIVGLLLAIPAFFLFGLVAIMLVVAGAVGMLIGPWMLRRMLRRVEAEVPSGDTTIELDHSSYADEDQGQARKQEQRQDQDRAAISRSSSSRKRGSTSA